MYRRNDVIAKMRQGKISNFSEDELNRVFQNCVSSKACKRVVHKMLNDGLTLQEITAEQRIHQRPLRGG